jgi:DNA polymerase III sliding clamp (beta) subunit (PCNA family)
LTRRSASIVGSHANPITIAVEDAKAVIRSASGVTRLWINTQPPPPLPTPDENAASFEVNAAQFARAVARCSWAHAENNSRSSIRGQIFDISQKAFDTYATDGGHLAYATVPF